jgi:hypothetical protein
MACSVIRPKLLGIHPPRRQANSPNPRNTPTICEATRSNRHDAWECACLGRRVWRLAVRVIGVPFTGESGDSRSGSANAGTRSGEGDGLDLFLGEAHDELELFAVAGGS